MLLNWIGPVQTALDIGPIKTNSIEPTEITRGDHDGNIRVTKIQRNHMKFRSNNVESRFVRDKGAEEEATNSATMSLPGVAVRDPKSLEEKKTAIRCAGCSKLQARSPIFCPLLPLCLCNLSV